MVTKKKQYGILMLLWLVAGVSYAIAGVLSDGPKTIGLWHMDGTNDIGGQYFVLDDNANYSRTNNLLLGTGSPTITSGNGGKFGEALSFNGIDQRADAAWPGGVAVKMDFWVYVNNRTKAQSITAANNVWDLQITTSGNLRAYFWDRSNAAQYVELPISLGWNHVIAVAQSGIISLDINGTSTSKDFSDLYHLIGTLTIGNKVGATRWFEGLVDEFHIINPIKPYVPAVPYQASACNTLLWHIDTLEETASGITSPQDPNGLYRLEMLYGNQPATAGNGPTLGESVSGFGNALELNGTTDGARVAGSLGFNLGIASDDFRVEAWIKSAAATNAQGANYGIMYHEDRFALRLQDRTSGGWGVTFVCWGNTVGQSITANYPQQNEWHHIVAEFYKGRMTLYIDGEIKAHRTSGTPEAVKVNSTLSRYMYIGTREAGTNIERFKGKIDEIRFSKVVTPLCCEFNVADINQDCYVDDLDIQLMAEQWLVDCTQPESNECL